MKNEIGDDFYCSTAGMADCPEKGNCIGCPDCHRKWPTPEQFKKEYDKEYPDDGAVYFRVWYNDHWTGWSLYFWGEKNIPTGHTVKDSLGEEVQIVCACTPFGNPDKDWRPE